MTASSDLAVSVVIPLWNNERYIGEAIASALAQTHPAQEIVVVDDGSTDDSAAIAAAFGPPVRILSTAHAGQGAARNRGARAVTGEVLAFLDADDLWLPTKLERQLAAMVEPPGASIAFAAVEQFFSPELGRTGDPAPMHEAEQRGLLPSTLVCRVDAFWRHGGFPEGISMFELLPWYGRALDAGERIVHLDTEPLVRRRIHDHNTGITQRHARSSVTSTVKAMLDSRRRAAAPPER